MVGAVRQRHRHGQFQCEFRGRADRHAPAGSVLPGWSCGRRGRQRAAHDRRHGYYQHVGNGWQGGAGEGHNRPRLQRRIDPVLRSAARADRGSRRLRYGEFLRRPVRRSRDQQHPRRTAKGRRCDRYGQQRGGFRDGDANATQPGLRTAVRSVHFSERRRVRCRARREHHRDVQPSRDCCGSLVQHRLHLRLTHRDRHWWADHLHARSGWQLSGRGQLYRHDHGCARDGAGGAEPSDGRRLHLVVQRRRSRLVRRAVHRCIRNSGRRVDLAVAGSDRHYQRCRGGRFRRGRRTARLLRAGSERGRHYSHVGRRVRLQRQQ